MCGKGVKDGLGWRGAVLRVKPMLACKQPVTPNPIKSKLCTICEIQPRLRTDDTAAPFETRCMLSHPRP